MSEALVTAPLEENDVKRSGLFHWQQSRVLRIISGLRLEEFIAFLFFIPCLAITLRASLYLWSEGYGLGRRIVVGGMWRVLIVSILMPLIPFLSKRSINSRIFSIFRNAFPFLICLAIYTNLHDTIHFVNPHDVQDWFLNADIWLFGQEPTIWAQRFYKPWLTELFSLCYAAYLPLTVLIPVFLYVSKKDFQARETLVGIVLCFYCGYFLYIVFPTVPPRLWIADQYAFDLEGGILHSTQRAMVSISESSSRAAFPSLHAAITLLTLTYAFRFVRKLFWCLLPLAVGLLMATIYLRHHYIVDLFAGFALAIFVHRYAPKWDRRWEALRKRLSQRYVEANLTRQEAEGRRQEAK